jgi:hypothetical protein
MTPEDPPGYYIFCKPEYKNYEMYGIWLYQNDVLSYITGRGKGGTTPCQYHLKGKDKNLDVKLWKPLTEEIRAKIV